MSEKCFCHIKDRTSGESYEVKDRVARNHIEEMGELLQTHNSYFESIAKNLYYNGIVDLSDVEDAKGFDDRILYLEHNVTDPQKSYIDNAVANAGGGGGGAGGSWTETLSITASESTFSETITIPDYLLNAKVWFIQLHEHYINNPGSDEGPCNVYTGIFIPDMAVQHGCVKLFYGNVSMEISFDSYVLSFSPLNDSSNYINYITIRGLS